MADPIVTAGSGSASANGDFKQQEKINKTLSDISITVGQKIILQHADSSGHAHIDVYVCLCLTSRQGCVLLGNSSWEP